MTVIGVDVGGTKILARFVDPVTGAASGRVKKPTPKDGPASVLAAVADVVDELDPDRTADLVGIGVPGLVDGAGVVARCPNISGWDTPVDVPGELGPRLGRTVVVGNDVNCGALAEHRIGAGQGVDDLLVVFVGTGVGGGLILDGSLRAGDRGIAGEIGHLTVVADGRPCGCGGDGHLEAYAGRAGIEREARARAAAGERNALVDLAGDATIKSRHIDKALEAGDAVAEALIDDAAMALAIGIGNLATVLDLERIVLGGGVVDKLGQPFVDQIAQSAHVGGFGIEMCDLRLGQRLDDAGVVGAGILAADRR